MSNKAIYNLAVGMTLRDLQEQRHIKRESLAEALEISDLAVTRIENGSERMTAGELILLIESQGLSWDDFLHRVKGKLDKAKAQIV